MVKESFLDIEEAQSNPFAPSGSSETNEIRQILWSGWQGIKLNKVDKVYKTPEFQKKKKKTTNKQTGGAVKGKTFSRLDSVNHILNGLKGSIALPYIKTHWIHSRPPPIGIGRFVGNGGLPRGIAERGSGSRRTAWPIYSLPWNDRWQNMTTPSADGWSLFEMRGRRLKVVGAQHRRITFLGTNASNII
jgi:hypothetical protein